MDWLLYDNGLRLERVKELNHLVVEKSLEKDVAWAFSQDIYEDIETNWDGRVGKIQKLKVVPLVISTPKYNI